MMGKHSLKAISVKDHSQKSVQQLQKEIWEISQKAFLRCPILCKSIGATSHLMKQWGKLQGHLSTAIKAGEDEWDRTVSSTYSSKWKESWATGLLLGLRIRGSVKSSWEVSFDHLKQRRPSSGVLFIGGENRVDLYNTGSNLRNLFSKTREEIQLKKNQQPPCFLVAIQSNQRWQPSVTKVSKTNTVLGLNKGVLGIAVLPDRKDDI